MLLRYLKSLIYNSVAELREMKTTVIVILGVIGLFLAVFFIGGASALSSLCSVIAYLSVFGIIMGFGALSAGKGQILLVSLVVGGSCLLASFRLDEYVKNKEDNEQYEILMQQSHNNDLYKKVEGENLLDRMLRLSTEMNDKDKSKRITTRVDFICDSLYDNATSINTKEKWYQYLDVVPQSEYRDAYEKIQAISDLEWNTEPKAWKQAQLANSYESYDKYLSLYPNSNHRKTAEKKLVDIKVAQISASEHGSLPQMERINVGRGANSTITVTNSTEYTLVLLYSGTDSRRLSLRPHESSSIKLSNGDYRIAAFVSASNVRSYAGNENLQGGHYSVEYYISSLAE